jgi:hypothetical protein
MECEIYTPGIVLIKITGVAPPKDMGTGLRNVSMILDTFKKR